MRKTCRQCSAVDVGPDHYLIHQPGYVPEQQVEDEHWVLHEGYPVDNDIREYVVTEAGERISPMASTSIPFTRRGVPIDVQAATMRSDMSRVDGNINHGDEVTLDRRTGNVRRAKGSDQPLGRVVDIDMSTGHCTVALDLALPPYNRVTVVAGDSNGGTEKPLPLQETYYRHGVKAAIKRLLGRG